MAQKMDTGEGQRTDDIYENADAIRDEITMEIEDSNTTRIQPPDRTESDCVKMRSSRAAAVCLVLLCVLLLTAVIVLCVHIYTNNTNYTEETNQLLTKITNFTEERNQLLIKITNLTEEGNQLLIKITNLTEENNQLKNKPLKSFERWMFNKSSLYFISSEKKNWTESRRDCTERGADLIIINNREEQYIVEYIMKSGLVYDGKHGVWIGLTDSDEEGTWKWVDGTNTISGFRFWGVREPDGQRWENCALSNSLWWADYQCKNAFQWICEKNISTIVLP